jgi:hypothetical protein
VIYNTDLAIYPACPGWPKKNKLAFCFKQSINPIEVKQVTMTNYTKLIAA